MAVVLTAGVAACAVETDDSLDTTQQAVISDIDIRRSLVVTEQEILARFPFERVMTQLVAQSEVPGLTALDLFHQWWDTQNPGPSLGLGPHCDDEGGGVAGATLNGFPYLCRPAETNEEGIEAFSDPFSDPDVSPSAYIPIGLFNRFDLAPADGSNCGEHRIVYARRSGIADNRNRNLIIFEASLPNPHPGQGIKGCSRIVKFWADLSKRDDIERRADDLEAFYFDGIANVPPVVHVDHYGNLGPGQIRTNQFLQADAPARSWNLREFKLMRTCADGACVGLTVVPVTDKVNPWGPLFAPDAVHEQADAFKAHFLTQVASLAADTVSGIGMAVPDEFNTAQSLASGAGAVEMRYDEQLGADPSEFRDQIAAAAAGTGLTVDEVVLRARAQSCAGCHRLNNEVAIGGGLVWPRSNGFTHVTERATEVVDGVERFVISAALLDEFLPARKVIVDDYMNDKPFNSNAGKTH